MKSIITILTLFFSLSVNATEWLTYYVYFETEYIQGTWARVDLIEKSEYKYLAPKAFEGLFGSEDVDLINTIISKLKENNPKIYNWTYDLTVKNDTVILNSKGLDSQNETVKNEITATLTLNNFKAVQFIFDNKQEVLTLENLTLPYFDLIDVKKDIDTTQISTTKSDRINEIKDKKSNEEPRKKSNAMTIWIILSSLLNIWLVISFIFKDKK